MTNSVKCALRILINKHALKDEAGVWWKPIFQAGTSSRIIPARQRVLKERFPHWGICGIGGAPAAECFCYSFQRFNRQSWSQRALSLLSQLPQVRHTHHACSCERGSPIFEETVLIPALDVESRLNIFYLRKQRGNTNSIAPTRPNKHWTS